MRDRAFRRHKREVYIQKCREQEKPYLYYLRREGKDGEYEESLERSVQRRHQNRAKCSCHMCGNPRKWNKEKTLKEKIYGYEEKNDEN